VILGEAYLGLGEAERALNLLREAVALMRSREQAAEAVANVALARALLRSERLAAREEIESALERARELTRRTGMRSVEPMIHVELAELAHQGGDQEERQQELREAHRLFTEIGATGHAERLVSELAMPAS
jgi:tetratricopeptide (TPR) repeat protein